MWILLILGCLFLTACESASASRSILSPEAQPAIITCQHDCDRLHRAWLRGEDRYHRLMVETCNKSRICLDFEESEHVRRLALIEEYYGYCQDNCSHEQGTGEGGQ